MSRFLSTSKNTMCLAKKVKRRKTITPGYLPKILNEHQATIDDSVKTNNINEGWHNRFRIVIGKQSDFYLALTEFQTKQQIQRLLKLVLTEIKS